MKSKTYDGAQYVEFNSAWWGPISCPNHNLYQDTCLECEVFKKNTRAHILAATEDVPW